MNAYMEHAWCAEMKCLHHQDSFDAGIGLNQIDLNSQVQFEGKSKELLTLIFYLVKTFSAITLYFVEGNIVCNAIELYKSATVVAGRGGRAPVSGASNICVSGSLLFKSECQLHW